MCLIIKTNVSFDVDNPMESKVYEAVQKQPHKQRSKYLLHLAYEGLMNASNDSDHNLIESMQQDINAILSMIKSGCSFQDVQTIPDLEQDYGTDEDVDIDETELTFMLGW